MLKKILFQLSIILIIGVIVWVCVLSRLAGGGPAPANVCKLEMTQISIALKQFEAMCGKLPTGDDSIIFALSTREGRIVVA